MQTNRRFPGFSLVEVVIAVGVFGVAVGAIVGVLPLLTRHASESAEAQVAQGLPDAIRIELTTLSSRGFDAFASTVPVLASPLQGGLSFVAFRNGEQLQPLSDVSALSPSGVTPGDSFFLIETWRFNTPPLAYSTDGTVLPLYVRVSWPYRTGVDATVSDLASRSEFTFTIALSR